MIRAARILFAAALMLLPVTAGHSASQQEEAAANAWLRASIACINAVKDENRTQENRLQACEALQRAFEADYANAQTRPKSDYEENYYWMGLGTIHGQLAGAMSRADGGLSRRTCEHIAGQNAALEKIVIGQLNEAHRSLAETNRATSRNLLATCRQRHSGL